MKLCSHFPQIEAKIFSDQALYSGLARLILGAYIMNLDLCKLLENESA